MGKARVVTSEFGMPISLGSKSYSVVGAESNSELSFGDFIFAANNDAFSFIILYHLGLIQNSTMIWLPVHSIEKYLKAYLLNKPNHTIKSLKRISHRVNELWDFYKKEYGFENHKNIEEFINEISEIKPNVRYGDKGVVLNDNLLSGFVFLIVHFNRFKRGSINYPKSYYGFFDEEFSNHNFISQTYLKETIKIYLHLIIEHQVVLSPIGICHFHKYKEVNTLKQGRKESDCPICNGEVKFDPKKHNVLGSTQKESLILIKYIQKKTNQNFGINE